MPGGGPKKDAASTTTARKTNGNGANLGFEAQLFLAADKLRKNLEPPDYKHVALGLIFLKHISNAFEAKRAALLAEDAVAGHICRPTPSSRPMPSGSTRPWWPSRPRTLARMARAASRGCSKRG